MRMINKIFKKYYNGNECKIIFICDLCKVGFLDLEVNVLLN